MKKIILTTLLCLLSLYLTNLYAGWYECYNFKGMIDQYPITLSIQVRAGYFGEKEKKDFNVIGVYKYDHHNNPIRLEGKLDLKNNKVLLHEISNDKYTAVLEFTFSENSCEGLWKNSSTNKTMPLHLNFVSKLIDTLELSQVPITEILQANSLPNFYFIGEYSKGAGEYKAHMNKLKIIRKKDNVVFQVIDFSNIESETGNVMTVIFDNVSIADLKKKSLYISNDVGRTGGYLNVHFNQVKQQFELNPEPVTEGPN